MDTLIFNLLEISILMSLTALILNLVFNVFSKSIPPAWKYYIWVIVLIGLLIPFRPVLSSSILTVNAPEAVKNSVGSVTSNTGTADTVVTGGSGSFWSQIDIPMLILGIWLAGIAVFLLVVLIRHIRFMRIAKRWGTNIDDDGTLELVNQVKSDMNIHTDISIIKSRAVSVPMMAGVFQPILFLPDYDLEEDELTYIIRHEMIHYRKFDILFKFLSILANAVHWFNPLVYIMQRWIYSDCEVACDHEVTKTYEHDERIRYAESIIGVAQHEIKYRTVFSTNFYDGKKAMKKRLESLLTDSRARFAVVVTIVIALMLTSITAGSIIRVNTVNSDTAASNGQRSAAAKNNGTDVSGDTDVGAATVPNTSGNGEPGTNTNNGAGGNNADPGTNNKAGIGEAKAQSIALERAGGGTVSECTLDDDDGVYEYEITVINGDYEYEIDVEAATGNILTFDKEKTDNDDNDD